jgi:thioredoxin 1
MSKAINDADFESEVVKASLPVVIDFWAPWCGPCKAMGPIIDELSKEMEGKVSFVKMNVDENIDTPGKFNVMSIPTFVVFKNGEAVRTFVGAKSKEDFKKEVEAAIA